MLMFVCWWSIVIGRGTKKTCDTKTVGIGECLPGLDDVCLGVPKKPRIKIVMLMIKITLFIIQNSCLAGESPTL